MNKLEEDEDVDLYLSVMSVEQTEKIAQTMHENGASDEEIGYLIQRHLHDRGDPLDGVTIYMLREQDGDNREYGVVVSEPESLSTAYGLSEQSRVRELMESEMLSRGNDEHELKWRSKQ